MYIYIYIYIWKYPWNFPMSASTLSHHRRKINRTEMAKEFREMDRNGWIFQQAMLEDTGQGRWNHGERRPKMWLTDAQFSSRNRLWPVFFFGWPRKKTQRLTSKSGFNKKPAKHVYVCTSCLITIHSQSHPKNSPHPSVPSIASWSIMEAENLAHLWWTNYWQIFYLTENANKK